MSKIEHTPTPWQIEGKYKGDDGSLYLSTMHPMPVFELVPIVGTEQEHIADAEFIAKAVNSHDANCALIEQMAGALNFILAFYEPGQRYLDTNAWVQAEASGRRALAAAKEHGFFGGTASLPTNAVKSEG